MESHEIYIRAVHAWREREVPLLPPVLETELIHTFDELDYPLSTDVRSLYTAVGGFAGFESDRLWSLWSLGRVLEESESKRRPFVMFADWLISSHVYCFHYENTEESSVYISHNGESLEPDPVAASVMEFFEKLLRDPNEVEAWNADA